MASLSKVRWLLVFTLFALPLLFFPFTYLAFELPKVFSLYLFSIFTVYILLVSGYRLGKFTRVHWLYLIFLGWIIFTAILGLSFQQSFLGSYFRMQGILSWICYSLLFFISGKLFADSQFRFLCALAILISAAFTSSLALLQFISLWFFGNTSQLLYNNRVISTFGQPNFLGAYLVLSLPFVWYLYKHHLSSPRRRGSNNLWIPAFAGMTMVLIVLGIFSTLSRSAYLGLIILSLFWGFYHYRLLLTGIIFSIILFAILANLFPNLVFREWYRFQVDTISKWTAENRLVIAQKSVKLVLQKPVAGYGLENFSLAFPGVVSIKDLGLKDIVVDSSHNLFLDLAVQTGLIGLGLFLAILALTIHYGLKQMRIMETEQQNFTKASICVVIAFLAIHQFSPISVVPMILFWISIGIINPTPLILSPPKEDKGSSIYIIRFLFQRKIVLRFIGLSLIGVTTFFIIQTIRADILFRNASAYEVSDINRAIKLDNEAIKLAPWIEFYKVRRDFLLKQLG